MDGGNGVRRVWGVLEGGGRPVAGLPARAVFAPSARLFAGLFASLDRLRHSVAVAEALLRMFARELRAVTLRVAAYACAFAAMALVAVEFVTLQRNAIVADGRPAGEWIAVAQPF